MAENRSLYIALLDFSLYLTPCSTIVFCKLKFYFITICQASWSWYLRLLKILMEMLFIWLFFFGTSLGLSGFLGCNGLQGHQITNSLRVLDLSFYYILHCWASSLWLQIIWVSLKGVFKVKLLNTIFLRRNCLLLLEFNPLIPSFTAVPFPFQPSSAQEKSQRKLTNEE